MRCVVCHHEMSEKRGEIDLRIEGRLYIARNVVHDQCPACGERVLSPEVTQDLFDRIRNREFIEETFKIPVLDGTYG